MKPAVIFLCSLLLTACMSPYVKPVSRDYSNKFDGIWVSQFIMDRRYQVSGNWEFTCSVGEHRDIVFVEDGHLGTLKYGPDGGIVDSDGNFLLRQNAGTFTTINDLDKEKQIVIRGKFALVDGEGEYLVAHKGSDTGCKGVFTSTKDNDAADKIIASISEPSRDIEIDWEASTANSAMMWTNSINKDSSWIVIRDTENRLNCLGYWHKLGKLKAAGDWSLYCGDNTTVYGNWQVLGANWSAEGQDSQGRKVRFSGEM